MKNELNFKKITLISAIEIFIIYIITITFFNSNKKIKKQIKRFYEVLPFFIKLESNGIFELNKSGLKKIPYNYISYYENHIFTLYIKVMLLK